MENIFEKLGSYFEVTETSKLVKAQEEIWLDKAIAVGKCHVAKLALFYLRFAPEKLEAYLNEVIEQNKPIEDEK